MLPSSNNDPIISNYTNDQTLLYHKPFITNDHLFSNLYHHFPFSPTFIHYETNDNDDDFFLQQYQDLPLITTSLTDNNNNTSTNYNPTTTSTAAETTTTDVMITNSNMVDYSRLKVSTATTPPGRKRTSKRDRHSKINTAQGPRDRRMRLSLDTARDFFGLQDMLGYDKASRTVEWLLSKAKSDIKKLVAQSSAHPLSIQSIDSSSTVVGAANTTSSSASECEVISGGIDHHHEKLVTIDDQKPSSKCVNKEKKRLREVRKAAFRPARARESREKARARARERTKVKMCAKSKLLVAEDATTNQDSNQLGSSCWSPTSLEVQLAEVEKPSSHEVQQIGGGATTTDMVHDDHSLVIMDKWSPASIFNYMHGSTGISQEHQFADFEFYSKPWEPYNIQSIL